VTHQQRLGFVGIGIMGEAMTLRLIDKGWRVTVWHLTADRYATVAPAGAEIADSPAAAGDGKILVDLSTLNRDATRDAAARLRQQNGMRWIGAPVSGGAGAARAGTMTVMAGGDAGDIAAVGAVMADMAGRVIHLGPLGAGQTAKILNQAIVGTGYVLMAEALALAEKPASTRRSCRTASPTALPRARALRARSIRRCAPAPSRRRRPMRASCSRT
jgi:3-hydroxyisobutyrate dehydrogenase